MIAFAAAPGTFQLSVKRVRGRIVLERHAVVGWTHIQGSICFPLLAINSDVVKGRKAILHPTGEVSDMRDVLSFDEVEDWLDHVTNQLEETEPAKDNVRTKSDIKSDSKESGKSRAKSGSNQSPAFDPDLESLL
jgi:hypothetical protein